jgi:carboxyl-terminal processing protease
MKKSPRSVLLVASAFLMLFLLGGGLVVRVGAAEGSYRQTVLFAEILAQVLDNYVDPVEADALLRGAYEGMLSGLDPNGAFLTPDEVREWKQGPPDSTAGPGFSVLKTNHTLQVVAVEPGSNAADAGVEVGDHVRSVDGTATRDLSLEQVRRRLHGSPGSIAHVEILKPADGFRREVVDLVRKSTSARPYVLHVERGTAILELDALTGLPVDELSRELATAAERGVSRLLLDLRNLADADPRESAPIAALFVSEPVLQLRDRSGRLIDTVQSPQGPGPVWTGTISVLTNGATAGGAEALALLLRTRGEARVYGQSTYGLGAEPRLLELENGSGILVSSSQWETSGGQTWNSDGVEPDEVVEGTGDGYAAIQADQLRRVLDALEASAAPAPAAAKAA